MRDTQGDEIEYKGSGGSEDGGGGGGDDDEDGEGKRTEMNEVASLMAKDRVVVVSTFSGGSHVGTRHRLTFPLRGRGRRTFHDGEEL